LNRLNSAQNAIISAETSIRSLVADAAKSGDYDEIVALTELAKAIADITLTFRPGSKAVFSSSTPLPTKQTSASHSGPKRSGGEKTQAKRAAKKTYPNFIVLDGELVKIGWSKSAKKEYQHKAPRNVLFIVAEAIKVQLLDDGSLRAPHEFLPLMTPNGETIPDYQSYLCLAWLREIGIVERRGRHGYCVPDPTSIEEKIEQSWNELINSSL
jgi:hypothetical protein